MSNEELTYAIMKLAVDHDFLDALLWLPDGEGGLTCSVGTDNEFAIDKLFDLDDTAYVELATAVRLLQAKDFATNFAPILFICGRLKEVPRLAHINHDHPLISLFAQVAAKEASLS